MATEKNLLSEIEERIPGFSKGQKMIASYLLENYDKAAFLTASKLGNIVKVSESTVVRFAIELGYDGYPGLQRALHELVRTNLNSVQRMEVTDNLIGEGDILTKVLSADSERIKRTLDAIDRCAFDKAVDKIVRAKNIYIIGVRSSSSLAGFLNYNFRMIFDNVKFIQSTAGSEIFEQIMGIGSDDALIAITFPRYSKRIVNAVEYAHNSGADIVAITDSEKSPIAPFADQLLIAQSDMASFVDSLVAPLSIIDALIVAISLKKKAEIKDKLSKLEQIWDEYDVYDKSHERNV